MGRFLPGLRSVRLLSRTDCPERSGELIYPVPCPITLRLRYGTTNHYWQYIKPALDVSPESRNSSHRKYGLVSGNLYLSVICCFSLQNRIFVSCESTGDMPQFGDSNECALNLGEVILKDVSMKSRGSNVALACPATGSLDNFVTPAYGDLLRRIVHDPDR